MNTEDHPPRTGVTIRPHYERKVLVPKLRTPSLLLLLGFAVLVSTGEARAQGFDVYEQGACVMGRAGATVADPCTDASTLFFNPAGLASTRGFTATAGATLIIASGAFVNEETGRSTDLDNDPIPAPHLYLSYGLNDRWATGLGVYVPYGLGTQWPRDFEGAFLGYDNSLQSIYVQPTLAVQITDRIALGAGPVIVFSSVELNQVIDLSSQPVLAPGVPLGTTFGDLGVPFHTAFADARLEGSSDVGFGANVGLLVDATDRLSLGVRYLTPITLTYDGDATFTQVETGIPLPANNPFGLPAGTPLDVVLTNSGIFDTFLSDQGIETEIEMPAQVVAGIRFQATDRLKILADYQWIGWSSFDVIPLDFEVAPDDEQIENYEDTNGFRFGAEFDVNAAWSLRAGYLFNEAAAPDETVTPLLPEADRNHVTLGLGWRATQALELNASYQLLLQGDRRGRVRDPEGGAEPSTALNSGTYSFRGHLIGATITLHLGE